MRVRSRTNGRSAIDTAAQDVEAPDAPGLLAQGDGEKRCAGRQVVRQVGRGGALHSITQLLPAHDSDSSQPQGERPFAVAFATETGCAVRQFTRPTLTRRTEAYRLRAGLGGRRCVPQRLPLRRPARGILAARLLVAVPADTWRSPGRPAVIDGGCQRPGERARRADLGRSVPGSEESNDDASHPQNELRSTFAHRPSRTDRHTSPREKSWHRPRPTQPGSHSR
jgi:hypothetical protein